MSSRHVGLFSKATVSREEIQRKNWSIFCEDDNFVSDHAQQLEQSTKQIGKTCTIQSVSIFSANPRAGQQVSVVVDSQIEFSQSVRLRLAEKSPEGFIAFVQPNKSLDSSEDSIAASIHLLSPGGTAVRSMSVTAAIAAVYAVTEVCHGPPLGKQAFPALIRDGRAVRMRVDGGDWKEELLMQLEPEGITWAALSTPRLLSLVPVAEVMSSVDC